MTRRQSARAFVFRAISDRFRLHLSINKLLTLDHVFFFLILMQNLNLFFFTSRVIY